MVPVSARRARRVRAVPRSIGLPLAFAVAVLAVCSPSVSAAPVLSGPAWSLDGGGTQVAGVAFEVRLTGDATGTAPADPEADADPAAAVAVLPMGVDCPASYAQVAGALDQEAWHWVRDAPASQPFSQGRTLTVEDPGTYPLCGYFGLEGEQDLELDVGATTGVYGPASVTVTRPVVSQNLQVEGPLRPGGQATLTGTLSSNAPETVEVYLNRGAQPCAADGPSGSALDQFGSGVTPVTVFGSAKPVSASVSLPDELGVFRLCVYASRDGHEGDPDLVEDAGSIEIERPVITAELSIAGTLRPGQSVVLSGTVRSDVSAGVDVYLNEAGAECRPTGPQDAQLDQLGGGVSIDVYGGGERAVRQLVTLPARVGAFHLCVYGARDGGDADPDLVRDLGPVMIGRPIVTARAALQGFLVPNAYVRVVGTASSDAPAFLSVLLNHRDEACAPSSPADQSFDRFPYDPDRVDLDGVTGRDFALGAQLPDRAGTYHLCLYGARDGADSDPDLVADSAAWPDGLYLVQPQESGIGEVVYADGSHGTTKVRCAFPERRPVAGKRLRLSCPHATGTVRFSYRRIRPYYGEAHARQLKLSSRGDVSTTTKGLAPGLYRVRVQWKGWIIRQTTVRVLSHAR